jgi:[acyl-carrier-protein] S-malonyltransferase
VKIALLFPGQGAQKVGMGKALADQFEAAKDVFARANEAVGFDLSKTVFEGPDADLQRTDLQQPAIVGTSIAALEAVRASGKLDGHEIVATAGLSLGEYAALYAAGALNLEDAVRLVRRRGELMQQASEAVDSGMAVVIGLSEDQCREACDLARELGVVAVANLNSPGQVVIAGGELALKKATELCKEHGAKRVLPLKVAGAFHTPLMQPAAEGLAEALADVSFAAPAMPVVQNVSAEPVRDPETLKKNLVAQLTGTVLWQRSVERMAADGVEQFYELGPGKTLAGMVKRIAPNVPCVSVGEPGDLESL